MNREDALSRPTTAVVTLVMYHYVRPLQRTRFPAIKGLDLDLFREQLDYLQRHYQPISLDQLIAAARGDLVLPPRAVLLTFDDGYADHYQYVFPILVERRISASFFPPSQAVLERRMLAVNKIHFTLAAVLDTGKLVADLEARLAQHDVTEILSIEAYRQAHRVASRFDTADVAYLKRMLQFALPAPLRGEMIDHLFQRFVTCDETAFAEELYVTRDQLHVMVAAGMHVGSHGHRHVWLNHLTRAEQAADIDASLALLDAIGIPQENFTFCYPYGGRNADTLDLLKQRGCVAAITTEVDLARLTTVDMLQLPRLDTNDLPKNGVAEQNRWYHQA